MYIIFLHVFYVIVSYVLITKVHVHHVAVEAPHSSPNTDGFDPDSSRNVLVEHSSYVGGDDCVAIKSGWDCFGVEYNKPCSNIHIRNLTCDGPEAGVAIGYILKMLF
jgi:polygalacturonase